VSRPVGSSEKQQACGRNDERSQAIGAKAQVPRRWVCRRAGDDGLHLARSELAAAGLSRAQRALRIDAYTFACVTNFVLR
jgi:ribosomal protein L37E